MKTIYFILSVLFLPCSVIAQSKIQPIVEGGKALVELIRIIKSPRSTTEKNSVSNKGQSGVSVYPADDSCLVKTRADLCYRNISERSLIISLFRRKDDGYEPNPFTMKVLTQKQECWYQLKAGIYKYRIETDTGGIRTLLAEGELKLEACENMIREVSE